MSETPVAFDSILKLCWKQHRRIVLKTLAEERQSLTLDRLTEAILRYNHHTPPAEASEDVITEIHLSLCQVDLPKLASEGMIDYDPEHQLVKPTEQLDQVQPTISTILEADPSLEVSVER